MAAKTHHVQLKQIGTAAFEATASAGGSLILDGSPEIGGEGRGMRPMELLLTSLAGCSAMDMLHILRKQREPLEGVTVDIEGTRVDAVPSPFENVNLNFTVHGAVSPNKMERAARLSVEKYCSALASLNPTITVSWSARLADSDVVVTSAAKGDTGSDSTG